MPDKIPDWKFDPVAVPWVRWAQNKIVTLEREAERRRQGEQNTNKGQNATIETLSRSIAELETRMQAAIDNLSFNMSQITGDLDQSRVKGTWDKGVNTVDTVVAGAVTSAGSIATNDFVYSPAGYNYDITYTRADLWIGNDGRMAFASSSREKKQDIEEAVEAHYVDPLAVLQIASKVFHYKAEISKRDDPTYPEYVGPHYHVALEFGALAEELHELGLWMVVAYEDHVKPVSIHYSLLGLLAIEATKYVWQQHLALAERTFALEQRIAELEAQG